MKSWTKRRFAPSQACRAARTNLTLALCGTAPLNLMAIAQRHAVNSRMLKFIRFGMGLMLMAE
jgi:hypothetical protein